MTRHAATRFAAIAALLALAAAAPTPLAAAQAPEAEFTLAFERDVARADVPMSATFVLIVRNVGDGFLNATLEASAAEPTLDVEWVDANVTDVPPGGERRALLRVGTGFRTPNGSYDVEVVARSVEDPTAERRATGRVVVVNDAGIRVVELPPPTRPNLTMPDMPDFATLRTLAVDLLPEPVLVPQGGEATAVVVFRNIGEDPIHVETGPAAEAAAMTEAIVHVTAVEPARLRILPGESARVTLTFRAERDAPVGNESMALFHTTVGGAAVSGVVRMVPVVVAPPQSGLAAAAALVAANAGAAVALGVAGVGGALALGIRRRESWRYAALAPIVGLFTRLKKSDVLDHGARDKIYALVRERPGIHLGGLQRETGLHSGALVHHLRTLERHGLVASRREGPNRRFYPAGAARPAAAAPAVTPVQERVLALLDASPLTQRELAERLGLTQQGASYHLKTLERKGQVARDLVGGEWRYARLVEMEIVDAR